jgi:septum formation protein
MLGSFELTVLPAETEAAFPRDLSIPEAVMYVAGEKAGDTAARAPEGSLVLGADTVVSLEGRILGKPRDKEDAFRMLRTLSGRMHTVYTGMALRQGERLLTDCARAQVWFRELTDGEIWDYIDTGSPLDKAGAYGAQDMAALFVERIEGEFYTVVGLPLCRLGQMLRAFGVSIPGSHG